MTAPTTTTAIGGMPLARGLPLLLVALFTGLYAAVVVPACLWPTGDGVTSLGGGVAGEDFLAFYASARAVVAGEAGAVFDPARYHAFQDAVSTLGTRHAWAYPPHFLLLIAPLGTLSFLPALWVWLVATTTPFVVMVWRRCGVALPVALVAPPIVQNTVVGQNGALTASLLFGGLIALAAGRSILAGILFGLLVYKPQVAVLLPIALLAARDRRSLVAFVVSAAALPLVSLWAFGLDIWWAFLAHLPDHMALVLDGRLPSDRFPTVFVMIERLTHRSGLAQAAQALSTLFAWGLVWGVWRRTGAFLPRLQAIAVAMPLATPFMLEYDLTIWAAPGLILAAAAWRGEGRPLDVLAMVLWSTTPPLVWLASLAHLNLGLAPVLALAAVLVARVFGPVPEPRGLRPIGA